MFAQILYTQFKWTRALLAVVSVLAFALPTFLWRLGADVAWTDMTAIQVVAGFGALGPSLAILAATMGFLVVAYVWSIDAQTKHVYPLSLPLPWSRYAAFRFAAGTLSMLLPALALWLGSLLVLAMIELPPTLRAFPGTLALRFYLAAVLAYALTFAFQYLLGRRAVVTLAIIVFGVLGVGIVGDLLGFQPLLERITEWLIEWPGPFAIYAADWSLVDV